MKKDIKEKRRIIYRMKEDDVLSRIEEHFHVLHLGESSLDLGKILSSDTSIKVLEAVYESDGNVGISAGELSEALGVGRTTVIYHLGRMQESGLVKINPLLVHEQKWKKFYDLYRKKGLDASKEQFNRLHDARMNGIKLYIPTKKGFLVMPSTDAKTGESLAKEAVASIASPPTERVYGNAAKTASVFGILGLLFLAFSTIGPGLPFMQSAGHILEESPVFMESAPAALSKEAAPAATSAPSTTSPPAFDVDDSRLLSAEKTLNYIYTEEAQGAVVAGNMSEYLENRSVAASMGD